MMRAASVLLIMVLLTSSVISGTFAKYVTEGKGTDSARVAKFGVTITANGDMFSQGYEDAKYTSIDTEGSASVWNKSGDGKDLVAPGTSGSMVQMTLTGTPEVDVRVSYAAEVEISDNWTVNTDPYFPLVIKVNGTPVSYAAGDAIADIEAKIEAAIAAYTKDYQHNTNLSTVAGDSLEVTWEWPFETGADAAEIAANDKKDTALGDKAVSEDITISVAITTTVTQID